VYCCRYFLPPIIFSAGLSVRKKSFFRNFVSIASLGILGTYVALTFIVLNLLLYRKSFGFLTMQVLPQACYALKVISRVAAYAHLQDCECRHATMFSLHCCEDLIPTELVKEMLMHKQASLLAVQYNVCQSDMLLGFNLSTLDAPAAASCMSSLKNSRTYKLVPSLHSRI